MMTPETSTAFFGSFVEMFWLPFAFLVMFNVLRRWIT